MAPTRPYHSSLRDDQARATRRRIVEAGRELFVERGYGATTVDAIAERAQVGRKTVFTSVGGKPAVLKLAIDWALVGDDEPVPVGDRPEMRALLERAEGAALLEGWMAISVQMSGRVAALYRALLVAADGDPDAAALLVTLDDQRFDGARVVMGRLAELGGLRPDLTIEQAAAIADVLIDPMPYHRLVIRAGWTPDAYAAFVKQQAATALLAQPPPRRRRRAPA